MSKTVTYLNRKNEMGRDYKSSLKNMIPFLGLACVILFFSILTGGRNLTARNIQLIAMQSVLLMIGATGATFTLAHGSLDFSLGGLLGMAAMCGGIAGAISPILTLPAILIGAILGELFVMVIHHKLNIPAMIVALATMFIARGVLQTVTQTVQVKMPTVFNSWDRPIVYFSVLAFVLITAFILFEYTKIGKYNRAIGSNYKAAITSGVPVVKYKAIAFIVSGAALGISAFLNLIRAGGVGNTTGSGFEINVLIALVLGGNSISGGTNVRLRGAIIGCLILTILENGLVMMSVQPATVGMIKGIIFLASITLAYDRSTGQTIV